MITWTKRLLLICTILSTLLSWVLVPVYAAEQELVWVSAFENSNHPQVGYWFITPRVVEDNSYLAALDEMIDKSLFGFYFLDAREGADFRELDRMHKVVSDIVRRAHERGVKVGIRLKKMPIDPLADEDREGFLGDCTVRLNRKGSGSCKITKKFIRHYESVEEMRVFRVFAFKQTEDGFYDPDTLVELTDVTSRVGKKDMTVSIDAGPSLAGYHAFAMAELLLPAPNNFSPRAVQEAMNFIDAYKDIPLDGVMLDEYHNWAAQIDLSIAPIWDLSIILGDYRNRRYSNHLAQELKQRTGEPVATTMLHMRYAPSDQPEVRMKAINIYMDLMREATLRVEQAVFDRWQEVYGEDFFMTAHNTLHNNLDGDEIWNTGLTWWSIPRVYGHTDERTPKPVQMGVAMAYPINAMYNMYYHKSIKHFQEKAFNDLCYGIRTHYHAFNDRHWGISLDRPEAYEAINPVENAARLLNRFNPSLPEIKLLVVFGMEALQNWYPDESARGRYDVNDSLHIEEKAVKLWDNGYHNALVPSDLVNNGQITLGNDNRPLLNGHSFDAVVYLYPQYSKQTVQDFLDRYIEQGGKLILVGDASHDFTGKDLKPWFNRVSKGAIAWDLSSDSMAALNIERDRSPNTCRNEDGSVTLTDIQALQSGEETRFELIIDGETWSGTHTGLAVIAANAREGLNRYAATGGRELKRNGQSVLQLDRATDLFIERNESGYHIELLDMTHENRALLTPQDY